MYTRIGQGGRGNWAVDYNSPQGFIISFPIRWPHNFGDFYQTSIDWWLSAQTVQPLIVIYRRGNFVPHR